MLEEHDHGFAAPTTSNFMKHQTRKGLYLTASRKRVLFHRSAHLERVYRFDNVHQMNNEKRI